MEGGREEKVGERFGLKWELRARKIPPMLARQIGRFSRFHDKGLLAFRWRWNEKDSSNPQKENKRKKKKEAERKRGLKSKSYIRACLGFDGSECIGPRKLITVEKNY